MSRFNVALNQNDDNQIARPIDFAGAGDNIVIPAVAGKIIRVYKFFFVVSNITNFIFKDGSTALTGLMIMPTAGYTWALDFDTKPWASAKGDFIINSSNAVQVGGTIFYELPDLL